MPEESGEAKVSEAAHVHIEPNILNVLTIVAVLILGLLFLSWIGNKYPNMFGGLSTLKGN